MNLETVLKCAQMAARQQEAFLGRVDQDIQALIAELTPAEPVVAAPVEVVAEEAPAEEAAAEEAPAAE